MKSLSIPAWLPSGPGKWGLGRAARPSWTSIIEWPRNEPCKEQQRMQGKQISHLQTEKNHIKSIEICKLTLKWRKKTSKSSAICDPACRTSDPWGLGGHSCYTVPRQENTTPDRTQGKAAKASLWFKRHQDIPCDTMHSHCVIVSLCIHII